MWERESLSTKTWLSVYTLKIHFIIRVTKNFSNKKIGFAFVYRKLTFASVVGLDSERYDTYKLRLECVQNKFLNYLHFKVVGFVGVSRCHNSDQRVQYTVPRKEKANTNSRFVLLSQHNKRFNRLYFCHYFEITLPN